MFSLTFLKTEIYCANKNDQKTNIPAAKGLIYTTAVWSWIHFTGVEPALAKRLGPVVAWFIQFCVFAAVYIPANTSWTHAGLLLPSICDADPPLFQRWWTFRACWDIWWWFLFGSLLLTELLKWKQWDCDSTPATFPADTRCWPNDGLRLGQLLRRCPNLNPLLGECVVFFGDSSISDLSTSR